MIYRSTGSDSLKESDVLDILRSSQTRNQRDRVSGLLIYQAPQFVQMIEGPEAEVRSLYDRISNDPRHTDIELIIRQEVEQAAMPTWAMGYFSSQTIGTGGASDPFVFDKAQIRAICEALPSHIGAPFLSALGQ